MPPEEATPPKPETGSPGEPAADSNVLAILCVRSMVLFPSVVLPISVGRKRSVDALQDAVRTGKPIGVLLQRDPDNENPGPEDLYKVGTSAHVRRYITAP